MSNDNLIFDPDDAAYLEGRKLMTGANRGVRSLRRSLMTSEDSIQSTDSAIGMSENITVPNELQSLQTLHYIGYDEPTALSIWQAWTNEEVDLRDQFVRHATSHIRNGCAKIPDADRNNTAEWIETLRGCGLNQATIDAIVDATHLQVRSTQTAKYWAVDTMEIRFGALKETQKISKTRAWRRQQESGQSAWSAGGRFDDVPLVAVASGSQSNPPGTLVLYKAIAASRIDDEPGEIQVDSLGSENPGDFTSKNSFGLYFTLQHWASELYAKYARKRLNACGKILILKMIVPNNYIEGLPKKIFQFGDDWKAVVWHCRNNHNLKLLPKTLGIPEKLLLIGPICKSHSDSLAETKMPCSELITENNLMKKEDGEVAIQYSFQSDRTKVSLQAVAVITVISGRL